MSDSVTEVKPFRINERQLAYLVSLGDVRGDRLMLSLETLRLNMLSERTRTSRVDLVDQFARMLAAAGAGDGVNTVSLSVDQILAAGFPISAVKSINYWRAAQSAAAQVAIEAGWLPSLKTVLGSDGKGLSVVVTFTRGEAVAAKIAAISAKHAEFNAAKDAADSETPADATASDAVSTDEE